MCARSGISERVCELQIGVSARISRFNMNNFAIRMSYDYEVVIIAVVAVNKDYATVLCSIHAIKITFTHRL